MRPDQLIRRQLRRKLVPLLGERGGATAVEFAVLAPVLFLAVIGIIELAVLLTVQVLLEGSVREASRFGITGYTPAGMTCDPQIRDTIAQYTVGMVNMNQVVIVTRVFQRVRPDRPARTLLQIPLDRHLRHLEPAQLFRLQRQRPLGRRQRHHRLGWIGRHRPLHRPLSPPDDDAGLMRRIMGIGGWVALEASVVVRNEPW